MTIPASPLPAGLVLLQRLERFFDAIFGAAGNPLRHLGALGFFFLWIALASGIYLFIVLDTGIEEIHASIEYYTHQQWWLGGILRSLHRYAADALVVVMLLHGVREWLYGRFRGSHYYAWITGVPVIWLVFASGIGGYWLVWDSLGLFSATASAEWFDSLPIFATSAARNFLPSALNDRFFTLLVFLHIGIPLILLLALWAHIQRIAHADVFPARSLALGSTLMLLALALVKPTVSHDRADLSRLPEVLHLDWHYLFIHPLMYATSASAVWLLSIAASLALLALPFVGRRLRPPVAVVDADFCSGCRRCVVDCPYGAIDMVPHPHRPAQELARVDADLCAACGICAGSCPSSTPFRSLDALVTGIDLPQLPIATLRDELEKRMRTLSSPVRIVVFGCSCAAEVAALEGPDTAVLDLLCSAQLPPSFIEYALRSGVAGVFLTGCQEGSCRYRLGPRWTRERLAAEREPHLRPNVPRQRLRVFWADGHEMSQLKAQLAQFRQDLQSLAADSPAQPPYNPRRVSRHG